MLKQKYKMDSAKLKSTILYVCKMKTIKIVMLTRYVNYK